MNDKCELIGEDDNDIINAIPESSFIKSMEAKDPDISRLILSEMCKIDDRENSFKLDSTNRNSTQ